MEMHLVVVKPFSGFARGDSVTHEGRIAEILRGEQATHVVRVVVPSQKEG
jgi:hypothetical protein